ncbi:MAG: hypothetical protein ABJB66_02250 [Gemmatimonadaceae bacterium]
MRNTVRSIRTGQQRLRSSLRSAVLLAVLSLMNWACATVPLVAGAEPEKPPENVAGRRGPPRCQGYILLVENQLSRPVEIYEVGLNSERLVTVALHGITEVQMADHSQQYVAVSQGEVMAASNGRRAGDRVDLQKNCRAFF